MAPAYDDMIALIRRVMPSVKSLGTLFVPAEVNSVFNRNLLEAACRKAGLELIDVPANTSSDVPDASLALAARRPDAICQIPGNLTAAAFPTMQQAAARAPAGLRVSEQPGARRRRRDGGARLRATPAASRRGWPCA